MPLHVVCAASALFFGLGAIAVVNHRRAHRFVGRTAAAAMVLLAATGLAFLADPVFRDAAKSIVTQPGAPHAPRS